MVTVPELRDAGFGGFEEAVARWTDLASALDEQMWVMRSAIQGPLHASSWEGADADAARRTLERHEEFLRAAAQEARCAVTALTAAVEGLPGLRRTLWTALDALRDGPYLVHDDGGVTTSDGLCATARTDADARESGRRVKAILRDAHEADIRYAAALDALRAPGTTDWADVAADGLLVTGLAAIDAAGIPTGNPAQAARWWAGLDEAERQRHLVAWPDRIGALDGLPAKVRDRANRVVLAQERARLVEEIARTRAARDAADRIRDPRLRLKVTELKERLAAVEALEATLDDHGGSLPPAYLLGFDPQGDGRAIVAIGNPDTAAHTAVYVPGTGSDLTTAGEHVQRMRDLFSASRQLLPNESVSTIAWIDYDSPNNLLHALGSPENKGSPESLRSFLKGVGIAQGLDTRYHVTLIGHSYGSVVVGVAASRESGLLAQDIVVAGSPGMRIEHADALNISPAHVWVLAAKGDPIPLLGAAAHAPLGAGSSFLDLVTPEDPEFGANLMSTGNARGHSSYWDSGQPDSLENQAAVVAGRYQDVRLEGGSRGE